MFPYFLVGVLPYLSSENRFFLGSFSIFKEDYWIKKKSYLFLYVNDLC